jgi:hypothetical protein
VPDAFNTALHKRVARVGNGSALTNVFGSNSVGGGRFMLSTSIWLTSVEGHGPTVRAPGGYIVAMPRHQMNRAMRNNTGALQMVLGSARASTLLRRANSFSINATDVAPPRRTSHKCCAKQDPTAAAIEDLNRVTRRIDTAETLDWVKVSESIAFPSRFSNSK